ncbi:MAG: peptidase MA family metallohydrolase [Thermoanaerobaculia bacterium]
MRNLADYPLTLLLRRTCGAVAGAISQFSVFESQFACAALLLLLIAPAARAGVELDVRAGDGMEGIARGIRAADPQRFDTVMNLVGVEDAGPPILVLVAPESSELARKTPAWISGYAVPAEDFVVVFPQRAARYPIDGMEELLRHEVAHVLIERAAGGGEIPRWFNEGVATVAGESWSVGDRSMVTLTLARGGEMSFSRVDEMFGAGEPSIGRAYALSGAFVNDLLQREGTESVAGILARVKDGAPFEHAFVRVTGKTVQTAELEFWRRRSFWNRWLPLLSSSVVLWGLITLLATWATTARIRRDRARLAAMAEEDEREMRIAECGMRSENRNEDCRMKNEE